MKIEIVNISKIIMYACLLGALFATANNIKNIAVDVHKFVSAVTIVQNEEGQ